MGILSREKYRLLTRDIAPEGAPLQGAIDLAQELMEGYLRRKLDEAIVVDETTIAYRQRYGTFLAFPERMPVTDVTTSGWEYTNTGILKSASSGLSIVYNLDYITQLDTNKFEVVVSYTGGFTENTAPARLQLALAKLAKHILNQETALTVPSGVSSMSVGGVSISAGDTRVIPEEIEKLAKGFQRRRY